jgi:tRNA-splicing endonuclease subunit Sen34
MVSPVDAFVNLNKLIFVLEIKIKPEDILNDETERIRQTITAKSVYSQVPTPHPFRVTTNQVTEISVPNLSKFKIFRDLYDKGFFITSGDSFGCDFLAYPGDPMYFHSSQTVHIIDKHQKFDLKLLISSARLSVSVNKKCVFAYVNDDDEIVTYQTILWDNPKLKEIYPPTITRDSQS